MELLTRVGLALAMVFATTITTAHADEPNPENWATARARLLTEQGIARQRAGAAEEAVARFLDAIKMDGTYGPAYLGLASLRQAQGETDEALKVLDMALERDPGFDAATVARADVLFRAKRYTQATAAYLEALRRRPDDETLLTRVVEIAPRAQAFPVALGAARRLRSLARGRNDVAAEKDARITVRALEHLVAGADPVQRGREHSDPVRRAIARFSRL